MTHEHYAELLKHFLSDLEALTKRAIENGITTGDVVAWLQDQAETIDVAQR
jgi:hypothetical protein